MPCRCDYMEPTAKEKHRQEAAKLIVFFKKRVGFTVTKDDREMAKDPYPASDLAVVTLCKYLGDMDNISREKLLYSDAKDRDMRELAMWWEEHEKVDKKRREKEKKAAKKKAGDIVKELKRTLNKDELEAVKALL